MSNVLYRWEGNTNDETGFLVLFPETRDVCKIPVSSFDDAVLIANSVVSALCSKFEDGRRYEREKVILEIRKMA